MKYRDAKMLGPGDCITLKEGTDILWTSPAGERSTIVPGEHFIVLDVQDVLVRTRQHQYYQYTVAHIGGSKGFLYMRELIEYFDVMR